MLRQRIDGKTQKQFAARIGVVETCVSFWEQPIRKKGKKNRAHRNPSGMAKKAFERIEAERDLAELKKK